MTAAQLHRSADGRTAAPRGYVFSWHTGRGARVHLVRGEADMTECGKWKAITDPTTGREDRLCPVCIGRVK